MFAASKSGKSAAATATDPSFPYVPLLLETTSTNGQQNNTFLDSSTNNFTITRNGTPTQGSVTPYWPNGYWSNNFNGSDSLNLASNAALAVAAGDYTIELWVYITGVQNNSNPTMWGATSTGGLVLRLTGSTPTGVAINPYGSGDTVTGSFSFAFNVWYHIAVSRQTNSTKIFINGTQIGTTTTDSTNYAQTANQLAGFSGQYFTGYISNFRLVKGTAVYTAAFTPPTTPLTAITNTSLLTCQSNRFRDNSTNNFAITVNGTPKVQAFQPFSPAASYTTATYGGSGYFSGSGDYLTLAASNTFNFAGDFTIEAWVYPTTINTNNNIIARWQTVGGSSSTLSFIFKYVTGGRPNFAFYSGTTYSATGTTTAVIANQWNHIVVVRSGSTVKFFVNGVQDATTFTTSGTPSATNTLTIGALSGAGDELITGYMSNLRIVNGTAVYTANFTPPTAPVTAITNTALLTNYTNAGIYDAAVQNNVITVGDAQASTTQSKWSPTSMKFDGTGDWLTAIDSPQLQLGTGDFTIDGWLYLSANGAIYGIISKGAAATGWSVNVTVLNKLQFSYTASNLTGTTSLAASTWYYFAVVRSGSATGNLKLYLNGSVEATSGGAVTDNFNQTDILYVGASRTGTTPLNGYLQDVRITKLARTITTPTAAFPTR